MIITYKVGPAHFLKGPDNGILTGVPPNLVYTPNPGFVGIDSFQYSVSSTNNPRDSEPSLVTIDVHPVADTSFTGGGMVITGGSFTNPAKTTEVLLSTGSFVQQFPATLVSISGTGGENIFIGWPDVDIGNLLLAPSPSQTPLVFDSLQDNIIASINDFALTKFDSAYDTNGPLGIGTYVLGNNFSTTWGSRIPSTNIRKDVWADVVVYFSEPQDPVAGDKFQFVVLARLSSSQLLDTASSVYANELFNSGIDDGMFTFYGTINDDPMTAIKAGSITFVQDGVVTISYQGDGVDQVYPNIVFDPVLPPDPPVTMPPGISQIEVELTNSQAGGTSEYTFSFFINNVLPPDGQICIQFPFGFDIDDVNGICSDTIDGTFTATKDEGLLKIIRSNDGEEIPFESTIDITLKNTTNHKTVGEYFVEMSTTDTNSVLIDGPDQNDDAIVITAGDVDECASTVELIPDTGVLADGIETSMVAIVARDACGNKIQGATGVISSTVGSDVIQQPAFATDVNGEAFGTIAATVPGARTVSVVLNGDTSVKSEPTMTFSSGAPADTGSTVTASPTTITANGSESSTITITVVDALMNPVEGATVTLSSSGSGNAIFQPASATDSFGITTGTIITTVAEIKTITATVNGSLILSNTADVMAVAGAPSDPNSILIASPTFGVVADGVDDSSITVSVYDFYNNPIVGEPIALFSTGSNNTFTPQLGVTNSSGLFTSSFTTTTDEAKTITALSDTLGVLSDTAGVTFVAGGLGNITGFVSIGSQPGNDIPSTFYGTGLISNEVNTVYTHDITTDFAVPIDGKIVFDFSTHTGIDLSGVLISPSFIDGTFSTSLSGGGQILTIERQSDGSPFIGLFYMDLFGIISANVGNVKYSVNILYFTDLPAATPVDSPIVPYSPSTVVPVVQYLGSFWPADQLSLVVPDACVFDHWHGGTIRSTSKPQGIADQADPDPAGCGFGTKIPTGSGVIPDLGTPDLGGIAEVNQTWPSADKADFDAFLPPWV